jgi:hypothetical protein
MYQRAFGNDRNYLEEVQAGRRVKVRFGCSSDMWTKVERWKYGTHQVRDVRKSLERQVGVSLISCVLAEGHPLYSKLYINQKKKINGEDGFQAVIVPFQLQRCLTVNSCEYV